MPIQTMPERLELPSGDVRIVCDSGAHEDLGVQIGRFATVGELGINPELYTHGERAIVPDLDTFRPLTPAERAHYIIPTSTVEALGALPLSHIRIYATPVSRAALIAQLKQAHKDGLVIGRSHNASASSSPLTTTRTKGDGRRQGAHIDYGGAHAFRAALLSEGIRSLAVGTHSGSLLAEHTGRAATADDMRELFETTDIADRMSCLRISLGGVCKSTAYLGHTGDLFHDGLAHSKSRIDFYHLLDRRLAPPLG